MAAVDSILKAFSDARRKQLPLDAQLKLARQVRESFDAMAPEALADELRQLAGKAGWVELLGFAHVTLITTANAGLLAGHPDHGAAIERTRSAIDSGRAKAATMGESRLTAIQRWSSPTRSHCLDLSVGLPHLPGSKSGMCWDLVDLHGIDPLVAHLALAGAVDRLEFRHGERPPLDTPGPLDRYHPERFRHVHRYLDQLGSAASELGQPTAQDAWQAAQQVLASRIVEAFNRRMVELPHAVFDQDPPRGSVPITKAMSLASHALMFRARGKQIFDLPPSLVERFRQTDVDDVPMSMLQLPYQAFYLYWGPQPDLELEPGWQIDGAYVSGYPNKLLQVVVTCAPTDPARLSWWPVYSEPYYFQAFQKEQLGKDVGTAVDEVLAETLKELRHKAKEGLGPQFTQAMQSLQEEFGAENLPHIVDVGRTVGAVELDAQQRRHGTYLQALRLVINGLCYLTAYPDDSAAAYPSTAPRNLITATTSTDFRTAKRARDRLAELGYLPVHLCGQELQSTPPTAGHSDHHVRAHWRRGHWRRQPYGEGRQLRKLIWVMPMIVGANVPDSDQPLGHLYLVS